MSAENKDLRDVSQTGEEKTGQAWDVDRYGTVVVDVHVLLRQPKVRRQIAKAREIMKRFPPQNASQ